MFDFLGKKSITFLLIGGVVGLLLAGVEVVLSAYIVNLLSLLGLGNANNSIFSKIFDSVNEPNLILIGFVVFTFIRSLLHVAKGYFAVSANEIFVTRLRYSCIYSTLYKLGPRYNSSRVYSLVSDVFLKSALTFYGVAHSIPLLIQAIVLFIFLLTVSFNLAIVGVAFVGVSGFIVFLIQRRISKIVSPLAKINDGLYASLKRVLENLLLIRFCKLEKIEDQHVSNLLSNYLIRVRKSNLLALISENIPSLLGAIVVCVLFVIQLNSSEISSEIFIGFVYLFIRFVQSLSQLVSFTSTAYINHPYFKRSRQYHAELLESGGTLHLPSESKVSQHLEVIQKTTTPKEYRVHLPKIEVNDLKYKYDEKHTVIQDLSFQVLPGQQCVIIGPSGAGKSTLLHLLVGELQPTNGSVLVSDSEPREFFSKYSEAAAYAGPEPLLFEGTIRSNLLYGVNREVSDQELISVLAELGLKSWLANSGDNLDALLGEEGVGMSSGQAQRLSIARALLRKPTLLILDEVTSNLDTQSEGVVLSLLARLKGSVTVVLVTHSERMMSTADITVNLTEISYK